MEGGMQVEELGGEEKSLALGCIVNNMIPSSSSYVHPGAHGVGKVSRTSSQILEGMGWSPP